MREKGVTSHLGATQGRTDHGFQSKSLQIGPVVLEKREDPS